jgi:GTP cyclohydrolase IA
MDHSFSPKQHTSDDDDHGFFSVETPMRLDAFVMDDATKIELIEKNFKDIMHILGLDLKDDSLKNTPNRVAKMFVKEIFSGLNPDNKPKVSLFENKYGFQHMLVEKNIRVQSHCEHHFVPIIGTAAIGYIPKNKVVGLSKLNRIVEYYARRPQVQERLTMQIAEELKNMLDTEDVAVLLDAEHLCVTMRGIRDHESRTITSSYSGKFLDMSTRNEFLQYAGKKD